MKWKTDDIINSLCGHSYMFSNTHHHPNSSSCDWCWNLSQRMVPVGFAVHNSQNAVWLLRSPSMSHVRTCPAVDKSLAMRALRMVVLMAKIYNMIGSHYQNQWWNDAVESELQLEPTADSEVRSTRTRWRTHNSSEEHLLSFTRCEIVQHQLSCHSIPSTDLPN